MIETAKKILKLEAEAIMQVSSCLDESFTKAVELILRSDGRLVVSGMGKSGLVGQKISATLSSTGTPSFFLHPGEALHGDLGMIRASDILLLLSNSGETDEIVRLIPFLKRIGTKIIAMVGEIDSSLARTADLVLNAKVSREACPLNLAPTSSTTVAMALGDALAGALIRARSFTQRDFAKYHPSGSLGRRFISVKDLMHSGASLPIAAPETPLREGVVKMSQYGFGALIICGEDMVLQGIFTDGDLRRYFERATNVDLNTEIKNVMVKNPKHTEPERLAMEALKIMEDKAITSLPVMSETKVVGFLHLHDILKARLV
jgi:arabinose-5-phosphate isomerase